MQDEKMAILKWMKENDEKMKELTPEQEKEYDSCQECHICKERIFEEEKSDCSKHLSIVKDWLKTIRLDTSKLPTFNTVSYTHLTLPTICSV